MIPELTFEYLLGAVPIWGKPNVYFGSVALKADSGVFDDQFRYRLTVLVPDEGDKQIEARYYIGWKSYDLSDKDFALSYCSWNSQGKNTEVVSYSLLQWATFYQTSLQ